MLCSVSSILDFHLSYLIFHLIHKKNPTPRSLEQNIYSKGANLLCLSRQQVKPEVLQT